MEDNRRCSKCGHPVPDEGGFCPNCGTEFEIASAGSQHAQPRVPMEGQKPRRSNWPIFAVLGCLGLAVFSCPVCCIIFYGIGTAIEKAEEEKAIEKTQRAESFWNEGNKSEAVRVYKDLLKSHFRHIDEGKRPAFLSRVIEHDIENDNEESAMDFIRIGIERNLRIDVKGEKVSRLMGEAQEEIRLEEEERARQAEIRRQQRKAESDRGPKPSIRCVKEYLRKHLHDPGSVKYESWSDPFEYNGYWAIRVRYRAKNAFGAYVLSDRIALIQEGKVVSMVNK